MSVDQTALARAKAAAREARKAATAAENVAARAEWEGRQARKAARIAAQVAHRAEWEVTQVRAQRTWAIQPDWVVAHDQAQDR